MTAKMSEVFEAFELPLREPPVTSHLAFWGEKASAIVRAVNAHDALVEALWKILVSFDMVLDAADIEAEETSFSIKSSEGAVNVKIILSDVLAQSRAALALAEGRS